MSPKRFLRAIVFDCDGVLLESVDAKTEAYRALFGGYPGHLEAILAYHRANGGVSRYEKIRHVYRHILNQPLLEQELTDLCARFAELAFEKVLAAPLVQGVREFLRAYHERLPLFVASGTPQEELETILDLRCLRSYFRGVFGSPDTKRDILGRILADWRLSSLEVLVVGDAPTDWYAARDWGIPFIGRVNGEDASPLPPEALAVSVRDFEGLAAITERLLAAGQAG